MSDDKPDTSCDCPTFEECAKAGEMWRCEKCKARDAAAEEYTSSPNYKGKVEREAFKAGADWATAKYESLEADAFAIHTKLILERQKLSAATAHLDMLKRVSTGQHERELIALDERHQVREQLSALQAKCEAYETALEMVTQSGHNAKYPEDDHEDLCRARNYCFDALAAHKRPTKEASDE